MSNSVGSKHRCTQLWRFAGVPCPPKSRLTDTKLMQRNCSQSKANTETEQLHCHLIHAWNQPWRISARVTRHESSRSIPLNCLKRSAHQQFKLTSTCSGTRVTRAPARQRTHSSRKQMDCLQSAWQFTIGFEVKMEIKTCNYWKDLLYLFVLYKWIKNIKNQKHYGRKNSSHMMDEQHLGLRDTHVLNIIVMKVHHHGQWLPNDETDPHSHVGQLRAVA